MKKQVIGLVLVALALIGVMGAVQAQRELAQQVLRLHVIADSDEAADQALKLQVRDAVLAQVRTLTGDCTDRDEAAAVLQGNLDLLDRTAEATLRAAGCPDTARVTLGPERYPTRLYPTFRLPAGEYLSLRVELGSAQGQNWWCVVFPSLCTAAQSEDLREVAAAGGFGQEQLQWITEGAPEYEIDFKLLEWLEKLRSLVE